jgi:hypothetical protein
MKRFKPSLACFLVVLGQLCLIGELELKLPCLKTEDSLWPSEGSSRGQGRLNVTHLNKVFAADLLIRWSAPKGHRTPETIHAELDKRAKKEALSLFSR